MFRNKVFEPTLTGIPYRIFIEGLKSAVTKAAYRYMKYLKIDNNPDDLLRYQDNPKFIQNQIIDYLIYLKNPPMSLRYATRSQYLAAIMTFYDLNEVILNKKKIYRYLGEEEKPIENRGYTRAAGIITKFTISVDNNLLGYDHLAFMGINIIPGFADQTTEELSNLQEVMEIHEMHNAFDLFLKIRARDLNHMRDIIENKIRRLRNILETELMTVLKTKKEEQMVSLKKDGSDNGNGVIYVKELKSHAKIHERTFWN